jgi:hypothetical protein
MLRSSFTAATGGKKRSEEFQKMTWVEPTALPTKPPLRVLILVMTSSTSKEATRRATIRRTWGRGICNGSQPVDRKASFASLLFVQGSSECTGKGCRGALVTQDVLQVTAPDHYLGLSSKVLHAFRWVRAQWRDCAHPYSYVLKADLDSFVCPENLLRILAKAPRNGFYAGSGTHTKEVREGDVKWADPPYRENFGGWVRPYMQGGGYVLSWDLMGSIIDNAHG